MGGRPRSPPMRLPRWIPLATAFVAGAPSLARGDDAPKAPPGSVQATRNSSFGFDLFRALATGDANAFLSPHSVATALGMARAGAAGETAAQMDRVLRGPGIGGAAGAEADVAALLKALGQVRMITERKPDGSRGEVPSYQLSTANGVFSQKGWAFVDRFRQVVRDSFHAELAEVDFGTPEVARETINKWVEAKTKDKIKDLVPKGLPRPNTRMVLANAIHFKASWQDPFRPESTVDGPFTTPSGTVVTVKRMRRGGHLRYAETDVAQLVELPYQGRDTAMVVIVPKAVDGVGALVAGLSNETYGKAIADLARRRVDLELPKFSFTSTYELSDTLRGLGMPLAFDAEKADFSGITTAERIWIGAVLHKAFVAVDEEGTEAAAATAVLMEAKSMPRPEEPVKVVVDRPFLVVIRHVETGEILFLGRITDPTKN